jgi:PPE-repeat protein
VDLFAAPEITSTLIYSGPGSSSFTSAATAWADVAEQLERFAAAHAAITAAIPWSGPSDTAMRAASTAIVEWAQTTAAAATRIGASATAAAASFDTVHATITNPELVFSNRAQLQMLVATNVLGLNAAAIAQTEAEYAEMWARNISAMNTYSAGSNAATSQLQQLADPPDEPAAAAAAPAATTPAASIGSILSGLTSGFAGETFQSFLSSGPWAVPTDVLSLFGGGLWALSPSSPFVNAMNTVAVEAAKVNVAPTAIPAAAAPINEVKVQMGAANDCRGMAVPPSWAQPQQDKPPVTPLVKTPRPPYQTGIPVPPAVPVIAAGRSNQRREPREDPEYGAVSKVLPPHHPSGG